MGSVDVVVVGTGVVGMAIVLSAADAGLKVGLVGPGYAVPGAASQAAGRCWACLVSTPQASPAQLICGFATTQRCAGQAG